MPNRALVIVNPQARHGETGALLPAVTELFGGVLDHEIVVTRSAGEATGIAETARGFDVIVAVGGDGTVHEVLNGIMRRPEPDRPALGVVPTGSGNDYARTIGVSSDLSTAIRQLAAGACRRIDVGTCNGVWFANSLAFGLDARVTAKAVELKLTTGWSGLPLYLRALFFVLFRQFYAHRVTLGFDGEEPAETVMLLLAVGIGATYGGGFRINPDAIDDDGLLDVCVFDSVSLFQALWRLPFVITGHHRWMKPAHLSRHTAIVIHSEEPLPAQIDGEVVLDTDYDVRIVPGGLVVVSPDTR